MNGRLAAQYKDRRDLEKWCTYCKHFGTYTPEWLEAWAYMPEQERFFEQYERQLEEDLFRGLRLVEAGS